MFSIIAAASIMFKQPVVERTNLQMCQEVEHELYIQVETTNLITRAEADRIIARCYRTFVDAK